MKQREKFEVIPPEGLSSHNTASLTTLRGIRKEGGRVYRAVASGRLPSEEGTRRFFMLDKARVMLTAEQEAAVINGTANHGPVVDMVTMTGIPSGWAVAALYGAECHLPFETLHKLKEILPADAFTPLPEPFRPPPVEDYSKPMLRVFDGEAEQDPEPPSAA